MMTTTRSERRGKSQTIFNSTLKRFVTYRLSSRGKWIMLNNLSSPHLAKKQMAKLLNNE